MNNKDQKWAVVTGASSGIGFELAKQFAQNGFDLLIAAEDSGISAAADRLKALGTNVDFLQVDLADFAGVEELYAKIKSSGRAVDAIAINAGVGVGGKFATETDLDKEINMLNLNVVSTVHLAKRIAHDMVEVKGGKILFTSSIAGTMPGPYYAVYAASKAFVQSFAEAIRAELKETGVTVTALMPGATDTNFFERADMVNTKAGQGKKDDPAAVAKDGFDALMAGRDHVVAGSLMNNVQAGLAKVLPQTTAAKIHGQQAKPLPGKH